MAQSRDQTRVTVRDNTLAIGERLLAATKIGSLTELINVMFTRYGRHLEETWEVLPAPGAQFAQPEPPPVPIVQARADFSFDEPLTGL
jgi:hypothetical protein